MQYDQKKKSKRKKTTKKRKKISKHLSSEYSSYQPNSPLTQHYITTGAILPESKIRIKNSKSKIVLLK